MTNRNQDFHFAVSALLLCGVSIAALPAGARYRAGGETVTYALRPIYKVGDAARYKFMVHFTTDRVKQSDLDVTDSRFNMTLLEKVKAIAPGESVTLEDTVEKADGVFDDREIELTAIMPRITQTRDKTGAATFALSGGLAQVQAPVRQAFGLLARTERSFYPPAPVSVGGTWKIAYQEAGEDAGQLQGTATLAGQETVDGRPTLKIKVDYTAALKVQDLRKGDKIDVTYHFIGTENVDAKTFQLIRLEGKSDDLLPGGEKAKTELTLRRVTREDKTTENTEATEKKSEKSKTASGNTKG